MMRTRAAVAVEPGKPLVVMDVNLDGPRKGEVLVEIKATDVCFCLSVFDRRRQTDRHCLSVFCLSASCCCWALSRSCWYSR